METCCSLRGTGGGAARTGSGGRGGAGSGRGATGATATGCGFGAIGAGASRVVPHMPQNRFCSGFSLPQRGQRTNPPSLIAYDILDIRCRRSDGSAVAPMSQERNFGVENETDAPGEIRYITVHRRRLEVLRIPGQPGLPELVFLHEGLGSVSHWRDFPARVAASTKCPVTVYSRYGSGQSDLLTAPHSVRYMHDEALETLPALLEQLQIENPILVGHSDGGSIAIIFAGSHDRVRGLILLAPHVFVE